MKTLSKMLVLTTLGTLVALGGCDKDEGNEAPARKQGESTSEKKPTAKDKEPTPVDGVPAEVMQSLMKPYEECRTLLAADKAEGIADCAKAMSQAANDAHDKVGSAAKEHLTEIATASDTLKGSKTVDIGAVRLAFGEVSKPMVALLNAAPAAAKDIHVFECPMAKGYKRWAQAEAKMANPYMGTKMLECGKEIHDHHSGTAGGGDEQGDMKH